MSPPEPTSAKNLDIGFLSREYEPIRELGRGGMGWVVLARHRIARHEVAIKVSASGVVSAGDTLARLQREARVLSSLRHPNIVRLHDLVDVGRGRIAIVMEYVRGTSLAEVLRQHGPIPFDRCRSVLSDVMAALDHAHARGVVHRDVKPANVLLNRESWAAKLCDFGIARGAPGDVQVTSPEIISGTPAYMSPEQIDGAELDRRTDIYSAGLLAWEMLTGESPWQGLALFDILFRQKHAELTPVEKLRPETPPSLALTVEGSLAKDRSLRWQGVDEMREQLDADEPTPRLLQLRADRFAHELERRATDRAKGARPTDADRGQMRSRVRIAGDPSSEPRPPAGAASDESLPATVQMRVDLVSRERATPRSLETSPANAARPILAPPPSPEGHFPSAPLPASAATVPVPRSALLADPRREREAAEARRATPAEEPPTPERDAQEGDSSRAACSSDVWTHDDDAAATTRPETGDATSAVARHAPAPAVAQLPADPSAPEPQVEVLRGDRDRRVRGTLAGVIAVLTAVLLIWVIRSATNDSRDRSVGATAVVVPNAVPNADPSAAPNVDPIAGPNAPPLPALLPGIASSTPRAGDAPSRRPLDTREGEAPRKDSLAVDSVALMLQELSNSRSADDPFIFIDRTLRAALYFERSARLNEARRILDEGIAIFPREARLYTLRARVRQAAGQLREAWTDVELARRTGGRWDVLVVEAALLRQQQGAAEARAQLDAEVRAALVPERRLEARQAVGVARALVVAGDGRTALGVLGRLKLPDGTALQLLDDPYLRPLASDPRFAQIRLRAMDR